jgi:catechol 2,3-dioxygenase-like lactoylglutathione lyase family enzyme
MKRFHVNVAVADLDRSIKFYKSLFGVEPYEPAQKGR